MKVHCRLLLSCAAVVLSAITAQMVKAAPYASCITNNNGTIQFYLNESGGNVVVTYEDGSTNVNFDGQVTGLNLTSGQYSFSMSGHSSYAIAVTKLGNGTAHVEPNAIQDTNGVTILTTVTNLFVIGDPRGVEVNKNPTSPYFGRIYISRGGNSAGQQLFFDLNSDGTVSTAGASGSTAGVTTWTAGSPYSSPDRISISSNDDLVVGDWSAANAGVWLIGPNLDTNELLLGPISFGNGNAAGVHGDEVASPILLGNLATGATLLTVDSDLSTVLPNSLLVYSNITAAAIAGGSGWQTPPSRVGPEVAINFGSGPGKGVYLFPSLAVGPNGYIYSGEYRGGANGSLGTGDPAGVQVYNPNTFAQLWNSRYNGGKSDYFCTAAAGGSQCLPTDLAVSPDGKYLATVGVDNHLTICVLTNGIPDVATISTVPPLNFGSEYVAGATEVKWDLANNLYVLAAGTFGLTTWTLGQSATCTTFGNVNGTTNFSIVSLNPTVDVYATNNSVISQNNTYGNPTSGSFTIDRTGGSVSSALTVNFTYSGTATNGTYIAGSTGRVVLQPGQTVTNISIQAVTDGIPRKTTYLTLTITPSTTYTLGVNPATISILNTATPELIPSVGQSSMYNAFSNDYASVLITRLGDTNTILTLAAGNFTLTGTATENTDYTPPTTITFHPGDLTQTTYIYPLNGGQVPTHNPNLTYSGNKTVVLSIPSGSGYNAVTNTATLNIIDSAYPTAEVLYVNPLTNALDATNWNVTAADDNMSQQPTPDINPQFGFNLYNAPNNPIPPPPNGASNALMVTVNKSSGTGGSSPGTAVNLYMTNQVFSGNYAVRFNMNVIEGDCSSLESGSYNPEENVLFGINHDGMQTNLFFPGFGLGETYTNFASDGIFYAISDSGGRYDDIYNPYQGFIGNGSPSTNAGWAFTRTATSSSFVTQFKTNVFTCYSSVNIAPNFNSGWTEGGPGLPVNGSQTLGLSMNSWADVEIKQVGTVDSLWIDKTRIMAYTNNTGFFTNGFVMLGYEDPYDGGETPDTAVYYSNLRVVALTPPAVTTPAYNGSNGQFTFDFTSSDGDVTPASFTVQGATNLLKGFTTISKATIQQLVNGSFQVSVPSNGPSSFYRVLQN
ncbi:MAG TPA: Calx-beta domain-containing protein [Verrucomicrobiae bacterium]|nr:Calx-beta domain-containing protein [Verrucomicrobiae bacterium]